MHDTVTPSHSAVSIALPAWESATADPQLPSGTVHVWRAELTALDEALEELLSPDERARAARFSREHSRRPWIGAHAILRQLLGRYLARDPHALRFTAGPHGKPTLAEEQRESCSPPKSGAGASSPLHFNLSHSGGLALYAFSASSPVGVDVEVARRSIDVLAVAERALGPGEARRLAELEPALRERELLRAWTRHEARLKCFGAGIGSAVPAALAGEPWIAELDGGPAAAAAVAVEHPPGELRCWEWRPKPPGARMALVA